MTEQEKNDILAALSAGLPEDTGGVTVTEQTPEGGEQVEASDTAIEMGRWERRRGAEIMKESKAIAKALFQKKEDEDSDARKARRTRAMRAAADFYTAAFDLDPKPVEKCEDDRRHRFVRQLLETPDYHALHSKTKLDDTASQLATLSFAEEWSKLQEEEEPKEDVDKDIQALGAAQTACSAAREDVGDLENMRNAFGLGGSGANPDTIDRATMLKMFDRVKGSKVKQIIDLAGRYRNMAQAQQRQKTIHGQDEVAGIVLDNDMGRVLPQEMAMMADPDLEDWAWLRYLERSMMCREFRGVESKAKGPIVFVVDESGSMASNNRREQAKAMALAMAWVAMHQRRWACLVGFAGATQGTWLVLKPGKWDMNNLYKWLDHFFGGGTSLDVPLDVLPKKWDSLGCPKGKTDVIFATDAIVNAPPRLVASFLRFKQAEQMKVYSFIIGAGSPGDLEKVSDRVYLVDDLDLDAEGVKDVMAI